MKQETQLETIIRKSGMKPSECRCKLCKEQCAQTSCMGTPDDIQKIIDAGYADKLDKFAFESPWVGKERHLMYKIVSKPTGLGCVFFVDGLCQLHDKGLKPTEGRLSHHSRQTRDIKPGGGNSIALNVAKTWDTKSYLKIGQQVSMAKYMPNLFPAWEPTAEKLLCQNCGRHVANNLYDLAEHSFETCGAITDTNKPPLPLYSKIESNENNTAPKRRTKKKATKD